MTREPIYAALFALLAQAAPFATASRRLRHWSDVGPAEQPALFMIQKGEMAETRRGLPTKWTARLDVFIYAHAPDDQTSPAIALNPLLDAIEAALAPVGTDRIANAQTLGGLVSHAWIAGKIETDEGVLADQAVAILPIEILLTS